MKLGGKGKKKEDGRVVNELKVGLGKCVRIWGGKGMAYLIYL